MPALLLASAEVEVVADLASIQVILHPHQQLRAFYMLANMIALWRRSGHRIEVGPADRIEADVGILHVDLTCVPREVLPDNPMSRPLINGRILDISKRRISAHLLSADADFRGAVIVKPNANYRGKAEAQLLKDRGERSTVEDSGRHVDAFSIFARPSDVPKWIWSCDDFVVEKFNPEMEGSNFVLRSWVFFGPHEYNLRMISESPIVKASNVLKYDYVQDVPVSLRNVRQRLGVDFGKLDYVIVDGEAILFDVNKTPAGHRGDLANPMLRHLADGLDAFLD